MFKKLRVRISLAMLAILGLTDVVFAQAVDEEVRTFCPFIFRPLTPTLLDAVFGADSILSIVRP